ncbi:sensor domain-containing phosphodiesterase [Rhodovulum visakhapatnamense]|uniref:EAL domain-containing protein (Putative c-di-GMP-specific phosphodiesterase class I) n=1 Tax=Rhodovulum visakhapatnamense TaxID=364297 RepID=A0A4V3GRM8_9RHOB|nr:EAL domain-containing protein [Rhodovulum visakhapatnamense]TDX19713.1 EAL domain-containing protein (putative c-di-GMP-specific phosphodiesterase class I) [Rhodovulum visakhapatnamense]
MNSYGFREALLADVANRPETLRWKKRKILAALRDLFGMEVAFISRFTPTSREFDLVESHDPGFAADVLSAAATPLDQSYCFRIAIGHAPNLMPNAQEEPAVADISETLSLPVGAHLSVPIVLSSGRTYGMLCAFSRKPNSELADRDVALFTLCADLLSRDIEAVILDDLPKSTAADEFSKTLAETSFDFFLQPITSMPGRVPVGFELLTRFAPELGSVEQIFDRARHLDMVMTLEEKVARTASRVLARLDRSVWLAINFSVSSIESCDFEAIFPPDYRDRLVLEITEHERVVDYASFLARIKALRGFGFRIAVDDVGAGYSSLRHVLQLRPEILKIDRSFVAGIDQSPDQQTFVRAIREYAASYGGMVIAEGVETASEEAELVRLGAYLAQGYHIAKPRRWTEVLPPC